MLRHYVFVGVGSRCSLELLLRCCRREVDGDPLRAQCVGEDDLSESARLRHGVAEENRGFVRWERARDGDGVRAIGIGDRSEEHTSELQSRRDLVCRLLLEKKKKQMCT